jgi:CBS domain-containing protein
MTTDSIMTNRVITLKPTDKVIDALQVMHRHHVRNLPVVDGDGSFIGLFGVRRLSSLLLPIAARDLNRYSITDLSFLPDETEQIMERWQHVATRPVSEFLEKEKKLLFCTPDTTFPQLLELIDHSKDSSLPVIVIEGTTRRLVGMVSAWDIMEGIIMKLLNEGMATGSEANGGRNPGRAGTDQTADDR